MNTNRQSLSDPRMILGQPDTNRFMDADQQRAVAAILRHDLESSGAELVYYFVHELGVAEREAWQAVAERWRSSGQSTLHNL